MTNYLADKSYLAIKPEAIEGTAITPTIFVPLVSESIKSNLNRTPDRRMKGLSWKSDDLVKGNRKHEGDIVVYADPRAAAHCFNMLYKKGTTTGGATGYTHPFTVDTPKSYTIEIGKGNYAQRYFGVKADQLKLDLVDGKMQITLSIKAMGQFSISKLKTALSGAVTSLKLDHEYDAAPTNGLVIGDVISLKLDAGTWQDITLTAVTDFETVGFGSLSITAAAGNPIVLKPQTPSYTNLRNPFYQGGTLVGVSDTSANATTAAGAKATATPFMQFSILFKNNLLDSPMIMSQDPAKLLPQVREAQITVEQLFEDQEQRRKWMESVKQAMTLIAIGDLITGGTTYNSLTIKFHKIKATENAEDLNVGSYLLDKQTFEALYDSVDAYAIEVAIINEDASAIY